MKNANLRRYPRSSSLRRTGLYVSLLGISGALHLDVFDQPAKGVVLCITTRASLAQRAFTYLNRQCFTPRSPREALCSADADGHQVLAVRTLQNRLIGTSPGISTAELHDVQVGKNVVIKKAAEPARVPAAQGQGIALLVAP